MIHAVPGRRHETLARRVVDRVDQVHPDDLVEGWLPEQLAAGGFDRPVSELELAINLHRQRPEPVPDADELPRGDRRKQADQCRGGAGDGPQIQARPGDRILKQSEAEIEQNGEQNAVDSATFGQ